MSEPYAEHAASALPSSERRRIDLLARRYRQADPAFAAWAAGYGVIRHQALTQVRIRGMVDKLVAAGAMADAELAYEKLRAADRVASAGMWLVVHMTYARRVRLDGAPLGAEDFKPHPEGHTGGSLNMVPAYTGYLTINALDGITRAWTMGQGHCVAAIDALNVIVGNMGDVHAQRYGLDDTRLSRLVNDFYSFDINPDGTPASPLGSHVNAHTAGGTLEGGYLGFAELQYAHSPLPGERLVVFLSDGAFEEQRGSDWAPRWWRPRDTGHIAPIMILNGRRIEQRSQIEQQGGERWLYRHLRLNGFDPVELDGRDPASIAWGIHAIEARLDACIDASREDPDASHRVSLRYGIAETIKGFGFPGAGTNAAHNLPLGENPSVDERARSRFNEGCATLFVPVAELSEAIRALSNHAEQRRLREKDHFLATRRVATPVLPEPQWLATGIDCSPMAVLDARFVAIVEANPHLRPRVANPDELRSNKLDRTLDTLKHRVSTPEAGLAESTTGAVITALNEEAVICAVLGNKAGINLAATYEAFGMKMLGALRQEIIFARNLASAGRPPQWISVPLVLTSHTWENAKNEQSHQDPSLAEALFGEMADTAVVMFPPDANGTLAALDAVYRSHGRIAALVVPKKPVAVRLDSRQGRRLADDGAIVISGDPATAELLLAATGAYQLEAMLRAEQRLQEHEVRSALVYVGTPARLRTPRDACEAEAVLPGACIESLFPAGVPRVFLTHTRPEPYLGMLRRLDTGPETTRALGYGNRGGTLDVGGLLFANRCTWAHVVEAAAQVLGRQAGDYLSDTERAAIEGIGDPNALSR